jgi:hypothetical protein
MSTKDQILSAELHGEARQGQNVLLDGLTRATPDKFTVPACWTT